MFKSDVQYVGDMSMPDYVYYNADIINNETKDQINGATIVDPQIRFNETRDKAIVRDASQYYFSIVRFTMNGANQDLPLFIPSIQQGTGQANVNLTSYSLALSFEQSWNIVPLSGPPVTVNFRLTPASRFIQYVPETQNLDNAPIPNSTANVNYVGLYSGSTVYNIGNIVGSFINVISGAGSGPFYQVKTPDVWNATKTYTVGTWISYQNQGYLAVAPVVGVPPPTSGWAVGLTGIAPTNTTYWTRVADTLGSTQDLSTRYYWVYTYQHWLDLINQTLWNPANRSFGPTVANPGSCLGDLFNAFFEAWTTQVLVPYGVVCPFSDQGDFADAYLAPNIQYSPTTKKFSILADSDSYGERLLPFSVSSLITSPSTIPVMRLFLNSNMFGLFSGFPNTYWNTFSSSVGPFPGVVAPEGYVNEILFPNKYYQNVRDLRVPPFAGVAPLGFVPIPYRKVYWVAEQDYGSTDSLWSPVSSIVFTSSLLPVVSEFTGQPVNLGTGNLGNSTATTQSAFQPIVTDIALDTALTGAEGYRQFVYYAPSAEYRLSDFTNSRQEIRQIDIQVSWKSRLDNRLYPISMFNLSSVSLKMMFRRK
jgi:hypothetical protein